MSSTKASKYTILRRPVITEKTASTTSLANGVVFEVHPRANKPEIKRAVESIFDVKVRSVRTVNCAGKTKRVRLNSGKKRDWKKAYVYLQEGESIGFIEGL